MIKGIAFAFLAAIFSAVVLIGILHFFGIIIWLAGLFIVSVIIVGLMLFVIFSIFLVIVFFALFYYMVEKKPTTTPGEYTLRMEKGKHE